MKSHTPPRPRGVSNWTPMSQASLSVVGGADREASRSARCFPPHQGSPSSKVDPPDATGAPYCSH